MKSTSRLLSIIAVSVFALTLTACTASDGAPAGNATDQAVAKEAGALGSRVCFINETSVAMSVAPFGRDVEENARHFVGAEGPLSAKSELCFAGWNSKSTWSSGVGEYKQYKPRDVALTLTVGLVQNALIFEAHNPHLKRTVFAWSKTENPSSDWTWQYLSEGESVNAASGKTSFVITRRGDSEFYKEWLVRFPLVQEIRSN